MKKKLTFIIVTVLCVSYSYAQDFSTLWEGHFSYLNIKDIVYGNNKIYAASENAVFSYDIQTSEIETISTINGLSGDLISTIHYSETHSIIIIGYENGLIDVFSEQTDDVTTVVDILDKQTIPPDNKRINHFRESGDLVYISTDFGISVYDLSRLEFGDTYFIGTGGTQIKVSQTEIFEGYIYAACQDNEGIKRGLLSSTNLIDFQEWDQITTGNFSGIETINNKLYCTSAANSIFEINGTVFNLLFNYPGNILDLKSTDNNLIVTVHTGAYIYDGMFNLVANPVVVSEFSTRFTSAIATDEGIYIGTEDFGVLKTTTSDISSFEEIHPDGPLRNNVFSVEAGFGQVWASYGDFTEFYNPSPLRQYGISRLYESTWNNIPFDSIFGLHNLNDISINPNNPQQAFASSFQDGMLVLNNGESELRLDETNSGLESLFLASAPNFRSIRVSGTTFDNNGLLWSITSLIETPLKSYDPDSNIWRSYDFTDLIPDPIFDNLGFEEIEITSSGTVFVASFSLGVIGFNENGGNPQLKNLSVDGNLPDKTVRAIALDNREQLWIGTGIGLRVIYNTSGFFSDDNVIAENIVILENGIPKELLEEQYISDIKVDGSNNKWIGTVGSGIFYLSSDGQETIYHFTKSNSPLPSNNVNDISLDASNGNVYIATDRGLVSFTSGASAPTDELSEAYIYPNPVRPGFDAVEKKIKIKDITDNVNIKITDIEGNLVAEAQSRTNLRHRGYNLEIDGGTAYWNGKNFAGNKVASGVYLIMLSDLDTLETKVLKLMVVR